MMMMAQTAMRIMWRIDVVLERPIGREGIGYQRCHKTPPTPKTIMRRFQRRQRTEFLNGRVAFHRRFCREPEMEFPVAKSDTPLFRTAAIAVLLRPSPLPIAAGRLRQIPNGMSAARVRLRKPDGAQDSVWPGRTVRVRLVREGRLRLETRSEQHKFRPQRHCTLFSSPWIKSPKHLDERMFWLDNWAWRWASGNRSRLPSGWRRAGCRFGGGTRSTAG